MYSKERLLKLFSEIAAPTNKEKEEKAMWEFGSSFLDAIYISTDGQLWSGPTQINAPIVSEHMRLPNGSHFSLYPIAGFNGFPNRAIISMSVGLNDPKIGAHVIIDSKFKPTGEHEVVSMQYTGNGSLGFNKETIFTLMSVVAVMATEKR